MWRIYIMLCTCLRLSILVFSSIDRSIYPPIRIHDIYRYIHLWRVCMFVCLCVHVCCVCVCVCVCVCRRIRCTKQVAACFRRTLNTAAIAVCLRMPVCVCVCMHVFGWGALARAAFVLVFSIHVSSFSVHVHLSPRTDRAYRMCSLSIECVLLV